MIKTIEHPRLICPFCANRVVHIYRTKPIKADKRIIRVDRYFDCLKCKKTFKTVEYL